MMQALICLSLLIVHASCLYPSSSDVVELTEKNFDKLVVNSPEVWIVEFFAPWCGHCQSLVPEYSKAAKALKGVVKVGAVNAEEHKQLAASHGVSGYPTIKIFGANKHKPEPYNDARNADKLVSAAMKAANRKIQEILKGKKAGSDSGSDSSSKGSGKDVIELTDYNFKELVMDSEDIWLVEFFAPWCGHCKNLEPEWAKAASELKGKVKLGAVDATVHTAQATQYNIKGYPTIKYFAPGKKSSDSVSDYDGGRSASDIVQWALDKLAENIPSPEIVQLTGEDAMKKACDDKPLCVIAVLPHILDCQSKCRNDYLNTLTSLGDKYKKKMWGWLWAEAGAQPDVESALDIGGFGYPALAVVNAKKMKYTLLRGSFSHDGINSFLRDLSYGKGGTAPLKGAELPKIHSTETWDGKDGELPAEEEIDLSDVDLDKDEL